MCRASCSMLAVCCQPPSTDGVHGAFLHPRVSAMGAACVCMSGPGGESSVLCALRRAVNEVQWLYAAGGDSVWWVGVWSEAHRLAVVKLAYGGVPAKMGMPQRYRKLTSGIPGTESVALLVSMGPPSWQICGLVCCVNIAAYKAKNFSEYKVGHPWRSWEICCWSNQNPCCLVQSILNVSLNYYY